MWRKVGAGSRSDECYAGDALTMIPPMTGNGMSMASQPIDCPGGGVLGDLPGDLRPGPAAVVRLPRTRIVGFRLHVCRLLLPRRDGAMCLQHGDPEHGADSESPGLHLLRDGESVPGDGFHLSVRNVLSVGFAATRESRAAAAESVLPQRRVPRVAGGSRPGRGSGWARSVAVPSGLGVGLHLPVQIAVGTLGCPQTHPPRNPLQRHRRLLAGLRQRLDPAERDWRSTSSRKMSSRRSPRLRTPVPP